MEECLFVSQVPAKRFMQIQMLVSTTQTKPYKTPIVDYEVMYIDVTDENYYNGFLKSP